MLIYLQTTVVWCQRSQRFSCVSSLTEIVNNMQSNVVFDWINSCDITCELASSCDSSWIFFCCWTSSSCTAVRVICNWVTASKNTNTQRLKPAQNNYQNSTSRKTSALVWIQCKSARLFVWNHYRRSTSSRFLFDLAFSSISNIRHLYLYKINHRRLLLYQITVS